MPLVLLFVVGAFALGSAPEARGLSFNPHFEASLANDSPGAASDIVLGFSIDAPDPNFEAIVSFFPPEMYIAADADVPNGALGGKLDATATLGLINGDCNTLLPVSFDLMEASTDIHDTIPLYYGYSDYDNNGLPENVDRYPDFLARLAPNLQPIERLYGQTLVANVQTFVNFVVFEPGATIARLPVMDSSLGYPVVVFLNDPTVPVPPYVISDFCTPLGTVTTTFGTSGDNAKTMADESGFVLKSNPQSAGRYNAVGFVRSQWDADGDGIENTLDPCPFTLDPGWNPRGGGDPMADADNDGLPNSCDPSPNDANVDQDEDGYWNRQDICPLVAGVYPPDIDHDGIGDSCDPAPADPSQGGTAQRVELCVSSELTVGGGSGPAPDVLCPGGPDVKLPPLLLVDAGGEKFRLGTVVSLHVELSDPVSNSAIPATKVSFEVTGANATTGNCTTDNNGSCEFNFAGPNLGIDTINASADVGSEHVTNTFTVEWVNPPANDNFAGATVIAALPFEADATLAASGHELTEPRSCGIDQESVWFQYTPPSDAFVKVEATGKPGDYLLIGVFDGSTLGASRPVSCSYTVYSSHGATRPAQVDVLEAYSFASLEGGKTYHIQVGGFGFGGAVDDLTLEMSEAIRGDTNCDALVDGLDILGMLSMMAGFGQPSCVGAADFDCSGFIAPADVVSEMKLQAGVWTATPCRLIFGPG